MNDDTSHGTDMPDDLAARGAGSPTTPEPEAEPAGVEDEPITTGTLFIVIVFLMALAGMWGILYLDLIRR